MGVTVAVTRAALNTTTGTQDFTTTALGGLTPKAALFFVTYATADGTAANHMQMAVGATDGTNHWVTVARVRNGVTTGSATRRGATDAVVWLQRNSSNTIDIEAAFDSFITNGVRINITTTTGVALLLHVVLFAGSDLSAKVGTFTANSGDLTETTVTTTFQPDHLFFTAMDAAFNDTNVAGALQSLGVAYRGGSIQQAGYGFYEPHGQTTSDPQGIIQDDRVTMALSGGALSREFEVSAFLSDGFKLKLRQGSSSASMDHGYLALSYGGKATGYVGVDASPTSTGNDANTAPGLTPQFVMLLGTTMPALNTIYTDTNVWAQGVSLITSTVAYSVSIASEDAQTTTDTQSLSDDVALRLPQGDGTTGLEASLTSFDASGYTLNYSAVLGSARQMAVFAISVEFTGADGALSVTLGALTSSAAGTVEVSGASASTLGALTSSAAGTVAITGAAASTLDALTATSAGTVNVIAAVDVTLGALASTADGTVAIVATADVTLGSLALAAAATNPVVGDAAITLAALAITADGVAPVVGAAAITLANLTLSADGGITHNAAAAITLETLTSDATGAVAIAGAADITLDALTSSGEGYASADYVGEAAITLDALTSVAAGKVAIVGQAAVTLGALISTADGTVAIVATADVALDALAISAAGVAPADGALDTTLDALTLTATAQNPVVGSASITLDALSLVATGGNAPATGAASITLGVMTLSAAGVITALIAVYGTVHGVTASGTVEGMLRTGSVKGT